MFSFYSALIRKVHHVAKNDAIAALGLLEPQYKKHAVL